MHSRLEPDRHWGAGTWFDTAPVGEGLFAELDFRVELQRRADEAGGTLTVPYIGS